MGYAMDGDITVISSSASEFHFKVAIANDLTDLAWGRGRDSAKYLYRSIPIGMPYGSTVRIVSAVGHAPVRVAESRRAESSLSASAAALVYLADPIVVRGRQLVSVQIFPVTGDVVFSEVEVRLHFEGGLIEGNRPVADARFDRIFATALPNFDQARNWPAPERRLAKVSAEGPFSQITTWYKVAVDQSGLVKLTGAQLKAAGLVLSDTPSERIHLFNGGGLPLEVSSDVPRPQLTEVSILIEDGGDGVFDMSDYILFYGESVNRWWHLSGQPTRYVNNHYTDRNIYWLAVSAELGPGLRMAELDGSVGGDEDTVITDFTRWVHSERDTLFSIENDSRQYNYYTWYWFDDAHPRFFVPTPHALEDEPAEILVVAKTPQGIISVDATVNGATAQLSHSQDSLYVFTTTALQDGLTEIGVDFTMTGNIPAFLDYVDVAYNSRLVPVADKLDITLGSIDESALIEVIDEFSSVPLVLDLDDPLRPEIIGGWERSGGLVTFSSQLDAEGSNRVCVTSVERAAAPLSVERVTVTDLRESSSPTDSVDFIIVTADPFVDALQEYIAYQTGAGHAIRLVTVQDIYDNFSWGLFDPTAIRDFLKFAYNNYPPPAPATVLFVGDGHYDFLDHLRDGAPNYVPPFVHPYDGSYSYSDDNYVFFGAYGMLDSDSSYVHVPDRGIDMINARWPVRYAAEIDAIVAKTKRYGSATDFGLWRTRVALVADDEFVPGGSEEVIHTRQTEELQSEHLPALYGRDKIYALEHPFVNRWKPSVNDAIVDGLNEGRLLMNYVGHGNPYTLAHERIFTSADDLPRLNNFDHLPLVFAASCAIGFYDEPKGTAMAEEFLTHPAGGAIGVVSATRLVWSGLNKAYNMTVFDVLFGNDDLSICEAVYTAKLIHQYNSGGYLAQIRNDRAFIYMGDPFVRLARPRLGVVFSSAPDSLVALEPVTVDGEIVDSLLNPYRADGIIHIEVRDSEKERSHPYGNTDGLEKTIDYTVAGATIYRGTGVVSLGRFSFQFIPPLDIGYGGQGAGITVYAVLDSIDAAGVVDSIAVTDSIAPFADSTGPTIEYAFSGKRGFVSGDVVDTDDQLEIRLADSSGINLTGGLGHGITLEIDGESEKVISLTNLFEYDRNGFTTGGLACSLEDMQPGQHSFKVKAWDNANNSATAEFAAQVVADDAAVLVDVLNYPNPMGDSTRFSFHAPQRLESFSLDIFTLSGRKIRSFGPYPVEPGYHDDIVWKGRDFAGDRVATGVYIYKAAARSSGDREIEVFGKVVVIN